MLLTTHTLNAENQRKCDCEMFHVDQLVISENRNITATEVLQRQEENE